MTQYESFSHSLVASKLWLCQNLENTIDAEVIKNPIIQILGGWDNLLGFMLNIRRPNFYGSIHNYDISPDHIAMADKLCDHWLYEYPKVYNSVADIRKLTFNFERQSIFVNCSVDQIEGTDWFGIIPEGSLVCLQCTDLPVGYEGWDIQQSHTLDGLQKTYPLTQIKYSGYKEFDYSHLRFNRNMIIGFK
jgi:hypothetical protein